MSSISTITIEQKPAKIGFKSGDLVLYQPKNRSSESNTNESMLVLVTKDTLPDDYQFEGVVVWSNAIMANNRPVGFTSDIWGIGHFSPFVGTLTIVSK